MDSWPRSTFHSPLRRTQIAVYANAISGPVTPAVSVTLTVPSCVTQTTSGAKTTVRESVIVTSSLPSAVRRIRLMFPRAAAPQGDVGEVLLELTGTKNSARRGARRYGVHGGTGELAT